MRRGAVVGFLLGAAAAVAASVYADAAAVARALEGLRITGLLLIVLLHLPVVCLLGFAWRLVAGTHPPASRSRFLWARLVRDAGAEVLPFSQLGGFVLALSALGRERLIVARGAVSMTIDLTIEFAAKLPYVLAGLLALLELAPRSDLSRPLSIALGVSAAVVVLPLLARRRLATRLEALAGAIKARWPSLRSLDFSAAGSDIHTTFKGLLRQRGRLFAGFALHVGCWFLGAAETWVVFHLLGSHPSLLQALAIDSAVAGLRTFGFMIPAAAGVQEASYLLAAGVFGIPPARAIAASFARRARDLALGGATLGIAVVGDSHLALLPALKPAWQRLRAHASRSESVKTGN